MSLIDSGYNCSTVYLGDDPKDLEHKHLTADELQAHLGDPDRIKDGKRYWFASKIEKFESSPEGKTLIMPRLLAKQAEDKAKAEREQQRQAHIAEKEAKRFAALDPREQKLELAGDRKYRNIDLSHIENPKLIQPLRSGLVWLLLKGAEAIADREKVPYYHAMVGWPRRRSPGQGPSLRGIVVCGEDLHYFPQTQQTSLASPLAKYSTEEMLVELVQRPCKDLVVAALKDIAEKEPERRHEREPVI